MTEFHGYGDGQHTLMQILQKEKQALPAYCAGRGVCGKCEVTYLSGASAPSNTDRSFYAEEELTAGKRLACQSIPEGDFTVLLPEPEHILCPDLKSPEQKETHSDAADLIMAVDLGTTTIAATLLDPKTGTTIRTAACVNRQRSYGTDVIARIEAAQKGAKEELKKLVREDIGMLAQELGAGPETRVILSGNSVMQRLFFGQDLSPFIKPPFSGIEPEFQKEGRMLFLPGAGAFLGSDVVSGIVALNMEREKDITVLMDLGTNGEIVIGNRSRLLGTSAAAGPAFEGGNISCGVAGIPGAISHVEIENGITSIRTLEEKRPVGICGTGVLETVYELKKNGFVDENGCMIRSCREKGFPLASDIHFTAKDVGEVQLAKSAIRAAFETLRESYGASYDDIRALYLAGGFGLYLDPEKAAGIGLIPKELVPRTSAVGNTSLLGACKLAEGETTEDRYRQVAKHLEILELADSARFSQLFMEHMAL